MCKLIIANNKITQEQIDKLEADTRPVVKKHILRNAMLYIQKSEKMKLKTI